MVDDDTRVGHGATSILERELLGYIKAHTVNGVYIGEVKYLESYRVMVDYNKWAEQVTDSSKNTFVLADDDGMMRKVVRSVISEEFPSFEVELFENGTSLEGKLNDGLANVKLVILDDNMPGIRGSELIKLYAPKLKERKIPMILHYGGDERIGEQAVKDGAFAYLLKPAGVLLLPETIAAALNHPDYQIST